MEIEQELKNAIEKALTEAGFAGGSFVLEHPAELSHGDYSTNAALIAAKAARMNPKDVAVKTQAVLEKQKENGSLPHVLKIEVAGPGFINFFLTADFFRSGVEMILKENEAFGKSGKLGGKTQKERNKEKLLIEHTSPNPNKAMHLGHLRNNITGMAVANILQFVGYEVVRDAVDNDRGIAIAKLMWGYLKYARKDDKEDVAELDYWFSHQDLWQTPEGKGERPDKFVDHLYVLGAEDFKNEAVEKKVRQFVVDWENGDEKIRALWKKVLDYSHEGQMMTLKRLNNKWDFVWHEHEHYTLGKELIEKGLSKGIFKKLDDGAVLTDLSSFNIPDTVLIKSDGTSLYITQDIALTKLKKEKFKPNKMFWVIGPEQSLAMKQVFAVCEQLGIGKVSDFIHLAYGYMSLKGKGKMSSREGTVIYIDDLIDEAKKEIYPKIKENKETETSAEEMETLAETIALGAIKYSILKARRLSDIAFDFESSLSFEGDSGPYLQYTCVRARKIVEKAHVLGITPSFNHPLTTTVNLEKYLYRFPEVVERAGKEYDPHFIATYLIELAAYFNAFYAGTKIIDTADETSGYKVALAQAVAITINNGLSLLGIDVPPRM